MQQFNTEALQEKWAPILDHEGGIKDNHRRMVTAQLLENQEQAIREEKEFLSKPQLTSPLLVVLLQVCPVVQPATFKVSTQF